MFSISSSFNWSRHKAAVIFWWVGETVAVIVPTWVGYEKGQRLCVNLMFHFELWTLRHYLFYNKMICQFILSILYVLVVLVLMKGNPLLFWWIFCFIVNSPLSPSFMSEKIMFRRDIWCIYSTVYNPWNFSLSLGLGLLKLIVQAKVTISYHWQPALYN